MKIFITGASSGLGQELARQYSQDNELILLARREERLKELERELRPHAKSVELIVADVTKFEALQEKISHLENIDLVILNAGISLGHDHDGVPSIAAFKELFDVNVLANHAILEVLLPKLKEQSHAKIVFISSLASLISMPSSKVYSASKRALNAYAEGVRYKYAPYGVEVVNILPGFIKSELTDKNNFNMPFLLSTEDGVKRIVHAITKSKRFYPFPLRFYLIIKIFGLLPHFLREKIIKSIL